MVEGAAAGRVAGNRDHRCGVRPGAGEDRAPDGPGPRCERVLSLHLAVDDAGWMAAVWSEAENFVGYGGMGVCVAAAVDWIHVRARRGNRVVSVSVSEPRESWVSRRDEKYRIRFAGSGFDGHRIQGA